MLVEKRKDFLKKYAFNGINDYIKHVLIDVSKVQNNVFPVICRTAASNL